MGDEVVVKVAVAAANYQIDRPYDYLIPSDLVGAALPGVRVLVPFGAGNRMSEGIILAETTLTNQKRLKSILSLLDDAPVLDAQDIQLVLWMRDQYFCTVFDCAKAMLPAGLWFSIHDRWNLAEGVDRETALDAAGRSEQAKRIVEMICAGNGADRRQLSEAFPGKNLYSLLKMLREKGILSVESSALRGVGDKTEQIASLAVPAEEALAQVTVKRATAPLQYSVIELLAGIGSASTKEICYFTGASSSTVRGLEKKGLIQLQKREVFRRVFQGNVSAGPPVLNQEQQAAFETLNELQKKDNPAAALLYGVTGSGKTQIYIQLIYEVISRGKTAMVLVPEIGLTPQLLRIFTSHFGDLVAVLHSSLRTGERYDEWKRVKKGEAKVVIGTRSAVFAPLRNIGVIILDEEQESSYKSEQTPRYHARNVAKYRCSKEHALLLLGSATPSVETMYFAQEGKYHLLSLKTRFNQNAMPQVQIVDMKQELKQGNFSDISGALKAELTENLKRGEQSILFYNRRGTSRMVICQDCGEVPACPRCSVSLTYHGANGRLMCHHCGHSVKKPEVCPACGGQLELVGAGTQKIQEELQTMFPNIEIMRMDTDTVTAANPHEKMLTRFEKRRVPILVGTQMVAKGLDYENVTLVGVIAADLGLYVDDFRAGERTFSLLTQVVGRAGRGEKTGRAVIQTFTPQNEIISLAAEQNYDGFYEQEIMMRNLRSSPPFRDFFVITATGLNENSVLMGCLRLRRGLEEVLRSSKADTQLLGPAPASVVKINHRYRYRIIVCGEDRKDLRLLIDRKSVV